MKILEISKFSDQPPDNVMGIPSSQNLWTYSDAERKEILESISKQVIQKFVNFAYNGQPNSTDDEVHNYTCRLLSIECFYLSYKDAIKEGDGKRVLDCWRYFLPIFHSSGQTNYSNEALRFLCQYLHDLPPQQAEQLLYSRFVNTAGVRGRNIPLDLHQEHLNKLCKSCVKSLGSHKTKDAIVRCGKALGTLDSLLKNFDQNSHVSSRSGAHHSPSLKKDLQVIVEELNQVKAFDVIPNRRHKSFKNPRNILHAHTTGEIVNWASEHLKQKYFSTKHKN